MRVAPSWLSAIYHTKSFLSPISTRGFNRCLGSRHGLSVRMEDSDMGDFMEYMEALKNYEKSGVPKGAGTNSNEGFDLSRMKHLMNRLGNPQSKFKAVHIAGTKGKGSTAAFIANILRSGGYSVGCYTSPHVLCIRERMSIGGLGEPVSAKTLNSLFHSLRPTLDRAIEQEEGCLSHFEVLTAMAFGLFAKEDVDIAVIEAGIGGARDATNVVDNSGLAVSVITTIGEEHLAALGGSLESIAEAKSGIVKHCRPLVLGGPFEPHLEGILRDKASSMCSPVISACDSGVSIHAKGVKIFKGRLCQLCDIVIRDEDLKEITELYDVKLCMLGRHQLQNAATAVCATVCLRDQGWRLSDASIKAGLEKTCLPGRSQFLTLEEAEAIGLPRSMVLLDAAHTKDSARALMDMVQTSFTDRKLVFVVAMANDKDHLGFAREILSGQRPEAVFLTEAEIAGGSARTTSASFLRNCWIEAAHNLGITGILHDGMPEYQDYIGDQSVCASSAYKECMVLAAKTSIAASLKLANQVLRERAMDETGMLVVTGSLHIVSAVLASLSS